MGAMKRALVVCAAPITPRVMERMAGWEYELVIAADGGYLRCRELGITPDIILGDFDSAPLPDSPALVFPAHKDDTDCMLALREGVERGCTDFLLLGCTGGRLDHTIAAIQSVNWLADRGLHGVLLDEQHRITVMNGGESLTLWQGCDYFSLFALGDCCTGVTLEGAAYPLDDYTLTNDFPLGVSNKVEGGSCRVSLKSGRLLVITVCGADAKERW